MIYQVRANMFFAESDEANDFFHDCQMALPKSIVVNPDTANEEPSRVQMILNHHDENPNAPCGLLFEKSNTD